jgi:hypothetical protein
LEGTDDIEEIDTAVDIDSLLSPISELITQIETAITEYETNARSAAEAASSELETLVASISEAASGIQDDPASALV